MNRLHRTLASLVTMLAISLLTQTASAAATKFYTMPVPGFAVIGMIYNVPYVAIAPNAGGACKFINIGPAGGLTENVWIDGTSSSDIITFVASATTWCTFPMTPIVQNGRWMNVSGMGGNDGLHGGFGDNFVFGDWDNDVLTLANYNGVVGRGGPGDDVIFGNDRVGDSLEGDNEPTEGPDGNDRLCEHTRTVASYMIGGNGTDTHCGAAQVMSGLDGPDCRACGSGY